MRNAVHGLSPFSMENLDIFGIFHTILEGCRGYMYNTTQNICEKLHFVEHFDEINSPVVTKPVNIDCCTERRQSASLVCVG